MEVESILAWLDISLKNPSSFFQVVASLCIVVLVWMVNKYFILRMISQPSSSERSIQHLSLRAFYRVIAPLLALFLFMLSRSIFKNFDLPYKILDIAIPLSISLAVIRITVYMLRKAFTQTPILKAWENIIVILVWGIFILHILGVLNGFIATLDGIAIKIGGNKISLLGTIKATSSVFIFVLIALWVSKRIEQKLLEMNHLASYLQIGIAKTIRVIALIVAILIALDLIGFDLTTLTVLGGALGVGIGFGLQRIASNFISGFILLFDRSIRPNDVISIGASFGWVKELRARYVVIQDRDGVETLIPNENLVTTQVINWSYTDRKIRIKSPVQISYKDDPNLAMELMIEAANENIRVLDDPPAVSRLMGFGDNGINLELRFWILDPEKGVNNVRSDVNLAIWNKFKQSHVTIPYPQRDVTIKNSIEV